MGIVHRMGHWLQLGLDAFWQHPVERVRDAGTLVLGGVSAYLAWQAIKMGQKQSEIAERQATIAEKQDKILSEQMARKSELVLVFERDPEPKTLTVRQGFTLKVCNNGNRMCRDFQWCLGIEAADRAFFHFSADVVNIRAGGTLQSVQSAHSMPVFPNALCELTRLDLDDAPEGLDREIQVKWYVFSEDGRNPHDVAETYTTKLFQRGSFLGRADVAGDNSL